MTIVVWVEPKMYISNWYHELEMGILAALTAKHMKAKIVASDVPDQTIDDQTVVILAGETYEWYNRMLKFTNNRQITSCVVGCEHPMHSSITVTSDYAQVTYQMIQYLHDVGKSRIAFFGVNPSSPHDNIRLETYRQAVSDMSLACGEKDIYFTNGDIKECVSRFRKGILNYDAVLGANDLYAFFALMTARQAGLQVPSDLFIAGFGNTTLSAVSKPPITSATINLFNIGYQAISAISLMHNNNSLIQLIIKSDDVYYARESTACIPFSSKYRYHPNMPTASWENENRQISSFADPVFMDVVNYEEFLSKIDQVDYLIVKCIVDKRLSKRSQIGDACFLSETALDYRLKKLYKRFQVKSYSELYVKLIEMVNYIDLSKIEPT